MGGQRRVFVASTVYYMAQPVLAKFMDCVRRVLCTVWRFYAPILLLEAPTPGRISSCLCLITGPAKTSWPSAPRSLPVDALQYSAQVRWVKVRFTQLYDEL